MTSVNIAQPDVTLHLDMEGVIQNVVHADPAREENLDGWKGRAFRDTVGRSGRDIIQSMLDEACSTGVSAYRQVTQRFPSGAELPIEYTIVRLGSGGGLIAIGKGLETVSELEMRLVAAQEAMERDYWKLREVETRYRLLFDASSEAVLLINAGNFSIAEANPAAIRALGLAPVGRNLLSELPADERKPFRTMLQRVRDNGKSPGILVHLGRDRAAWMVKASLMTSESAPSFLLQLMPVEMGQLHEAANDTVSVDSFVERAPDGFVVIDSDGVVMRANRAFLDVVQIGAEQSALGERLGKWLGSPGADVKVLIANVKKHGFVRRFQTAVCGALGTEVPVEVSAVGSDEKGSGQFGIWVRDMGRKLVQGPKDKRPGAMIDSLLGKIGSTPLRELLKDTTGLIERQFIESALEITDGNRTAAAEILGLSRQSLHSKLNLYGMDRGLGKSQQRRS